MIVNSIVQGRPIISLRSMFVAAIILTPMPVLADVLGVSVGGGSWQASPEGDIGRTDINLESTLNLDEFRLIDWAAEIMYEFDLLPALDAGLILGYRSMLVELDDLDDLQADATFEGYYFALQLRF